MVSLEHGTPSFKGCARIKLITFNRLWEEFSQEEAQIVAQEENIGSEDHALIVHSEKIKRDYHHPKGKHSHHKHNPIKYNRDISKYRCFTCDERGHFARDCVKNKNGSHKKKDNKRTHHAHTAEDDEPSINRIKQESDDSSSDEEYVLISASRELSHMEAMIGL